MKIYYQEFEGDVEYDIEEGLYLVTMALIEVIGKELPLLEFMSCGGKTFEMLIEDVRESYDCLREKEND